MKSFFTTIGFTKDYLVKSSRYYNITLNYFLMRSDSLEDFVESPNVYVRIFLAKKKIRPDLLINDSCIFVRMVFINDKKLFNELLRDNNKTIFNLIYLKGLYLDKLNEIENDSFKLFLLSKNKHVELFCFDKNKKVSDVAFNILKKENYLLYLYHKIKKKITWTRKN
jgi:hypothetical protein